MIALAASTRPWARRSRARPGLRASAEDLGLAERLLGPLEVAHAAADLAELHEAGRGVHAADPDELRAGPDGLLCRPGPLTTRLQGPRPVDPAHAGEDGERVALGPTGRGVGPLGRPAEVAQLLAGADQAAVDLAGRVRTEPALDGGEHGLVEVAQPLLGPALVDQQTTQRLLGTGLEVGAAQPASELDHLPRVLGREVEVAPPVGDLRLPQDEVAVLGALGVAVEALTSPPQPRAADARLRPEAVVLVEPDRALSGQPVLAALVEGRERGLAMLDALVHATQPPRRLGEQVEASGLCAAIAIGSAAPRRGLVGLLPVVASERVPSSRERVDRGSLPAQTPR